MSTAAQPKLDSQSVFKHDLPASIVVFFVALPLCMGIAIASGVPVAAGILTGIIGGIVVGALSGSPLQVSGPAAGLTVIVYGIVKDPELAPIFGIIVMAAGALQLVAGLLGLGQWFRAVSPAVIQGMLAGIGVIIFSQQAHVMVDDEPRKTPLENIASLPEAIQKGLIPTDGWTQNHTAAYLGLLTILIIATWKWIAPKKLKIVPSPLVAIVVATLIAFFTDLEIIKISLPENIFSGFALPTLDSLNNLKNMSVVISVITIAIVASAETLLCANAVDQLHTGPRTKYDKELFAQGVGNSICGLFGALPMTGVIVRSSANVEAGAKTRASAIMHGVWLLLFVWLLTGLLQHIPRAALAAVLVFTGYKLFNIGAIKKLFRESRSELAIYFATLISIVSFDLLTGIAIGFGLALLKLVYTFSHLAIELEDHPELNQTQMKLHGAATFVRLPKLAKQLEKVPANRKLHVHLENLDYIDHACLQLLKDWERQHLATGGNVHLDWDEMKPRFERQRMGASDNVLDTVNGGKSAKSSAKRDEELTSV